MYKGLNQNKENDTYWDEHKSNSICPFNMKFCSKICAMAIANNNYSDWICGLVQSKYARHVIYVEDD